ncbi:MAG: PAS domain S-box protein [Nitrospirota bacterium]|nr:MAG: PAS domain S-box protein [Nitrospirota bacterium]
MIYNMFDISNYFFNPHAIFPAITFILMTLLVIIVLARTGINMTSVTLLLLGIALNIWFFCFLWMYSSKEPRIAYLWGKAAYFGIPFIAGAAYHFSVSALHAYEKYKRYVISMWAVSGMLSLSVVGTPFIITGVHQYSWGYHPLHGPGGLIFVGAFYIPLIASVVHAREEFNRTRIGTVERKRVGFLLFGLCTGSLGGIDFLANYYFDIFPIGGLSIFIALVLIVISIFKYNLVELTPSLAASNIINTMHESLFVLDNEWTVRLTNTAAYRLTGINQRGLVGKAIWEIFDDESVTVGLGETEGSKSIMHFDIKYVRKDGEPRNLNMSASALRHENGNLIALVCIVRDVTEEKLAAEVLLRSHNELEAIVKERTSELEMTNERLTKEIAERLKAEDALRAREERYRTLFENSLDAIFILDNKRSFIDANPAAYALFVATREEVIGQHIDKFIIEPESLDTIFNEIDETGLVLEREIWLRDRYGKELICILTASLWKNDRGKPIGYQGILRDVSNQRASEEEYITYE